VHAQLDRSRRPRELDRVVEQVPDRGAHQPPVEEHALVRRQVHDQVHALRASLRPRAELELGRQVVERHPFAAQVDAGGEARHAQALVDQLLHVAQAPLERADQELVRRKRARRPEQIQGGHRRAHGNCGARGPRRRSLVRLALHLGVPMPGVLRHRVRDPVDDQVEDDVELVQRGRRVRIHRHVDDRRAQHAVLAHDRVEG
jgi:hypothetical protein